MHRDKAISVLVRRERGAHLVCPSSAARLMILPNDWVYVNDPHRKILAYLGSSVNRAYAGWNIITVRIVLADCNGLAPKQVVNRLADYGIRMANNLPQPDRSCWVPYSDI